MPEPPASAFRGSFRDPSGEVFREGGVYFRRLREAARPAYERLMQSGLYQSLVGEGLLIPHEELAGSAAEGIYKILRPEQVAFISYPYEWSFGQFRQAARATLRIQELSLRSGLSLKDASAYNIQFHRGRAVLIDTLSFEPYEEGRPWIAYGQFARHFLAPLALMRYRDARLSGLLRVHMDGVPLDLATRLLPASLALRNPTLWLHLRLQASQRRPPGAVDPGPERYRLSRQKLGLLLEQLSSLVEKMAPPQQASVWSTYYDQDHNYSPAAWAEKVRCVERWTSDLKPGMVWDLGANTGSFARLAARAGAFVVALDAEPGIIEEIWRESARSGTANLLPLRMDLANPSPALGWAGEERLSLDERGPADLILALALVHHLAISNNVPLESIVRWFARIGKAAIVEFAPPDDTQVQRMLRAHGGDFSGYTQDRFEKALVERFSVLDQVRLPDSHRVLYLLQSHRR